jgi:hypothetical protein
MLSFHLLSFFFPSFLPSFLLNLRLRRGWIFALHRGRKIGALWLFVHIAKRRARIYGRIGKNAFVEKIENYSHNARNWRKAIAII